MRIALLGAESTGKTALAEALAAHFNASGRTAIAVPEVLREWCVRHGREPRPEEQLAIAHEQERRADEAATRAELVIADTTALMGAIYAAMLYEDDPLYRFAMESQRRYDTTLVMGLDLPWVADGLHRQGPQVRDEVDACVRAELARAGVPYRVIYGDGAQRMASALAAVNAAPQTQTAPPRGDAAWVWNCDKCSDPECEHRLFSRMLRPR
ncbi:MAG: ATP-binding protein [Pseudomonadota bacterium]